MWSSCMFVGGRSLVVKAIRSVPIVIISRAKKKKYKNTPRARDATRLEPLVVITNPLAPPCAPCCGLTATKIAPYTVHSFFHLRAATFAFASWVCHVWDKGRRSCRISGIVQVLVIRWVLNHPELVREVSCQWWVLAEAWEQLNNENKVSLVLDNYSELPVCHSHVLTSSPSGTTNAKAPSHGNLNVWHGITTTSRIPVQGF